MKHRVESTVGVDRGEQLLKRTATHVGDILASRYERELKRARRRRIAKRLVILTIGLTIAAAAIFLGGCSWPSEEAKRCEARGGAWVGTYGSKARACVAVSREESAR
jgi:hypothetical protein